jgi:hypothetical protein
MILSVALLTSRETCQNPLWIMHGVGAGAGARKKYRNLRVI